MRFFVLPGFILGTAFMLTSCSQYMTQKPKTPKTFHYSYQEPKRTLSGSNFSRQLSKGKEGSLVAIRLNDKRVVNARLGKSYFSASGFECRKYSLQSYEDTFASCQINGQWQEASPIVVDAVTSP